MKQPSLKRLANIEFYRQLIPALIGALIGGMLSLAGSYLATNLNYLYEIKNKSKEKDELIKFDLYAYCAEIYRNIGIYHANCASIDSNKIFYSKLSNDTDSANLYVLRLSTFESREEKRLNEFPIPSYKDTLLLYLYPEIYDYYANINDYNMYYNIYIKKFDILEEYQRNLYSSKSDQGDLEKAQKHIFKEIASQENYLEIQSKIIYDRGEKLISAIRKCIEIKYGIYLAGRGAE